MKKGKGDTKKGGKEPKQDYQKSAAWLDFVQKFNDDAPCREYLEKRRWPYGPVCPRCHGKKAYKLNGKSTRPGVYKVSALRLSPYCDEWAFRYKHRKVKDPERFERMLDNPEGRLKWYFKKTESATS